MGLNDINSLSHTKWNCKYHIVFAPKYRRKVFYKEKRVAIGRILRQLCEWKGVKIIGAEVWPGPQEQRVLMQGILCRHSRQKHEPDTGVHTKSAERR